MVCKVETLEQHEIKVLSLQCDASNLSGYNKDYYLLNRVLSTLCQTFLLPAVYIMGDLRTSVWKLARGAYMSQYVNIR